MLPRLLRPLFLLLLTGLLLAPGGAQAHDRLSGTDPEDGAVLEEAPESLTLSFSGEVAAVGVQLALTGGPGGRLVGEPVVDGREVVQELADLQDGDHEVAWRVTSSDGHPISGTLRFTVGVTTDEGASGTPDASPSGTPGGGPADDASAITDGGGTGATATAADGQASDGAPEEGFALPLPVLPTIVLVLVLLGGLGLLARARTRGRRG